MEYQECQNPVEDGHPEDAFSCADYKKDEEKKEVAPSYPAKIRSEADLVQKRNANACDKYPKKNGVDLIFKFLVDSSPRQ